MLPVRTKTTLAINMVQGILAVGQMLYFTHLSFLAFDAKSLGFAIVGLMLGGYFLWGSIKRLGRAENGFRQAGRVTLVALLPMIALVPAYVAAYNINKDYNKGYAENFFEVAMSYKIDKVHHELTKGKLAECAGSYATYEEAYADRKPKWIVLGFVDGLTTKPQRQWSSLRLLEFCQKKIIDEADETTRPLFVKAYELTGREIEKPQP